MTWHKPLRLASDGACRLCPTRDRGTLCTSGCPLTSKERVVSLASSVFRWSPNLASPQRSGLSRKAVRFPQLAPLLAWRQRSAYRPPGWPMESESKPAQAALLRPKGWDTGFERRVSSKVIRARNWPTWWSEPLSRSRGSRTAVKLALIPSNGWPQRSAFRQRGWPMALGTELYRSLDVHHQPMLGLRLSPQALAPSQDLRSTGGEPSGECRRRRRNSAR